jgi:hypothetical protein
MPYFPLYQPAARNSPVLPEMSSDEENASVTLALEGRQLKIKSNTAKKNPGGVTEVAGDPVTVRADAT